MTSCISSGTSKGRYGTVGNMVGKSDRDKNSNEARALFDSLRAGVPPEAGRPYQPNDQNLEKAYKQLEKALRGKPSGRDSIMELGGAIAQMLRLLEPATAAEAPVKKAKKGMVERARVEPNGLILIPAGTAVEFTVRGYCLDSNLPAPKTGEKFRLVQGDDLFDKELLPVYKGLMKRITNLNIKPECRD